MHVRTHTHTHTHTPPYMYLLLLLYLRTCFNVQRARDLFYAMWIPDLFMRRVEADGNWALMCPSECPGLHECWGEEFEKLYEKYEREGRARKVVKAQKLWFAILEAQTETGTPYMLYKDSCNRKSNQQVGGWVGVVSTCEWAWLSQHTSSSRFLRTLAPSSLATYVLRSWNSPALMRFVCSLVLCRLPEYGLPGWCTESCVSICILPAGGGM